MGASLIAQLVKNLPAMQDTLVQFLSQEDPLEEGQATHSSIVGLHGGSAGKESACNAGDLGLIPGLGKSPGEGKGYPLHYSGLKNSMDSIVHGLTKSRTQMSNLHFSFRQIFKINYLDKYLDYLSLQDWKRSVFIPIPKKRNAKEYSNYHTITLISQASKVMLKILRARLQQYMN